MLMACRPVVTVAKLDSKMKQKSIVLSTTKVPAEFQYSHSKWRKQKLSHRMSTTVF